MVRSGLARLVQMVILVVITMTALVAAVSGASASGTEGAIYTTTNSPAGNAVVRFDRLADGQLVRIGEQSERLAQPLELGRGFVAQQTGEGQVGHPYGPTRAHEAEPGRSRVAQGAEQPFGVAERILHPAADHHLGLEIHDLLAEPGELVAVCPTEIMSTLTSAPVVSGGSPKPSTAFDMVIPAGMLNKQYSVPDCFTRSSIGNSVDASRTIAKISRTA